MLTRDEILSKKDLKKEKLKVPEWGGEIYVSEMTGSDRDVWDQYISKPTPDGIVSDARATLVSMTVVGEDGKKLFKAADIKELSKQSYKPLTAVFAVAQRLNGLTDDDVEIAKGN